MNNILVYKDLVMTLEMYYGNSDILIRIFLKNKTKHDFNNV